MVLDPHLHFKEHLQNNQVCKITSLLGNLQNILPRSSLLIIFKSFILPVPDYCDNICDQVYNASFHQILEKHRYNAALAITGATRGASKENVHQELSLESLQLRL